MSNGKASISLLKLLIVSIFRVVGMDFRRVGVNRAGETNLERTLSLNTHKRFYYLKSFPVERIKPFIIAWRFFIFLHWNFDG